MSSGLFLGDGLLCCSNQGTHNLTVLSKEETSMLSTLDVCSDISVQMLFAVEFRKIDKCGNVLQTALPGLQSVSDLRTAIEEQTCFSFLLLKKWNKRMRKHACNII